MAEPFNYNVVSPMASFAQGLQVSTVLDQQRKAQEDQQRAQESEAALLTAFENELPTTEQISNLILKNPAIADRAKQAYAMRTAPQREADERQRTQLYMLMRAGDTEAVKTQMQTFADAARNSGREQEAAQAEANLRVYEQNPNAGMIAIGSMIAANNPELWNKLSQTEKLQAETGKIAAETSTEQTKAKFAESNAVMALEKQGWEIEALKNDMVIKRQNSQIAALNAAVGREGNDLKRQELQLKIAELQDKVTTRVQERAAEGTNALAQADNLLSSADKALKAAAIVDPKTGKVTGFTSTVRSATGPIQSRLPTISQDVADFEALIDNLGSQTVMARIGEMKGVLSDRDLEVLRTSMASLDLKQSPAALVSNLQKIQQLTNKAKKVTAERYGAPLSATIAPTPSGAMPSGGGFRVVGRRAG